MTNFDQTPIQAIVAISANGMIGRGSVLPWEIPEEFAYFRKMVDGAALVVGRATYDGIAVAPEDLFVVSRQADLALQPGWFGVASVEEGLQRARATGKPVFVIGGAAVYRASWRYCERFYVTLIDAAFEGDTLFPDDIPYATWPLLSERVEYLTERGSGRQVKCRFLAFRQPEPLPLPPLVASCGAA